MDATAITTLATPAAVLALVGLAKDLGLPTRYAALVATLLGVGLSVADHALTGSGVYQAVVSGLVMGLGAAGLYDGARLIGGHAPGGEAARNAA